MIVGLSPTHLDAEFDVVSRLEVGDGFRATGNGLDRSCGRRQVFERGHLPERMALFKNEGRGIRAHPSILAAQWQMRAAVEARAAEEAKTLAKQHRGMADAGR